MADIGRRHFLLAIAAATTGRPRGGIMMPDYRKGCVGGGNPDLYCGYPWLVRSRPMVRQLDPFRTDGGSDRQSHAGTGLADPRGAHRAVQCARPGRIGRLGHFDPTYLSSPFSSRIPFPCADRVRFGPAVSRRGSKGGLNRALMLRLRSEPTRLASMSASRS